MKQRIKKIFIAIKAFFKALVKGLQYAVRHEKLINDLETALKNEYEKKKKEKPRTAGQVLKEIAERLEIELKLLKSFLQVESSGKHYSTYGRLKIRFEPHIFKRHCPKNDYKAFEGLIEHTPIKHNNQESEYESLSSAIISNEMAAYKSISMGSVQIMGFNCKRVGFNTAHEMYLSFNDSEANAITAFGIFIETDKKLLKACREKDFHKMAYYYNGPKYKKYKDRNGRTYADKIRIAYGKLKKK